MHEFICPTSSDPLYFLLIGHGVAHFCAFYTPSSVRFVSGACLGIQTSDFFCAHFCAFCTPISVRFVSGACLGIQKSFFLICAHFAWFCIYFFCFLHSNFYAFCKWSLPGHPKKCFFFDLRTFCVVLHIFCALRTPIFVRFASGACLGIQKSAFFVCAHFAWFCTFFVLFALQFLCVL